MRGEEVRREDDRRGGGQEVGEEKKEETKTWGIGLREAAGGRCRKQR